MLPQFAVRLATRNFPTQQRFTQLFTEWPKCDFSAINVDVLEENEIFRRTTATDDYFCIKHIIFKLT